MSFSKWQKLMAARTLKAVRGAAAAREPAVAVFRVTGVAREAGMGMGARMPFRGARGIHQSRDGGAVSI
jgi:hypothetical protein